MEIVHECVSKKEKKKKGEKRGGSFRTLGMQLYIGEARFSKLLTETNYLDCTKL